MDRVTAQLGACVETSSLSLFGFKVFMDARWLVTPEEWGSLPPKAARFLCPCILSGRGPVL